MQNQANVVHGIGHNAPPSPIEILRDSLKENFKPLLERRDKLLSKADGADGDVSTEEQAGDMSALVKELAGVEKSAEIARAAAKEPHLEAGRVVDAWFKSGITEPVKAAKSKLQARIEKFLVAKAAAEQRKREEEAAEARAEAELAAAMATTNAGLEKAIERDSEAAKAEARADAKPAEMARTRSESGAVATLRTTWEFEIVDPTQIPRSYMVVNEQAIRAAIRTGARKIPGVRVYEKQTAMVR